VHGSALFGLIWLPLPPMFDLYAKVGFAQLQSDASVDVGNFQSFHDDQTNTRVAFGAGAQVKMNAFALRGQYDQFSSDNGDPRFWSIAFTWSI
jgi:hypothetical protein